MAIACVVRPQTRSTMLWRKRFSLPGEESVMSQSGMRRCLGSTAWHTGFSALSGAPGHGGGRLDSKLASVGITPVGSAEDYLVTAQESEQILEALSLLKRTDREILRLAVWEELSHPEIASVLDINTGAAKQRLSQARKNLGCEYDRIENRTAKPPAAQKGGGWW